MHEGGCSQNNNPYGNCTCSEILMRNHTAALDRHAEEMRTERIEKLNASTDSCDDQMISPDALMNDKIERDELVSLTDGEKLRLLAIWFDRRDDKLSNRNSRVVQDDLRRIAANLDSYTATKAAQVERE